MTKATSEDVLGYFQTLSNWGRWGAEDEIGTLNLISQDRVASAAALVSDGTAVSCSRPLDMMSNDPISQPHRYFTLTGEGLDDPDRVAKVPGGPTHPRWNCAQEYIGLIYHGSAPTHIDALSHMFWDGKMYNDRPAALVAGGGATAHAVDAAPHGINTRGVLLDVPAARGVEWLEPGEGVYPEDLEAAEARQNVRVESGDAVLLRTGHTARARAMFPDRAAEGEWYPDQAGWNASCLPWLHERGVALIAADNMQDQKPSGYEDQNLDVPIHVIALVAMGLWLLDNCDLEHLATVCEQRSRWEFFFTVAALRMPGATGSPVNPIAIF